MKTTSTIARIANNKIVSRNKTFWLASFCMAAMFAGFTPGILHAAVTKRNAYVVTQSNQIDEFTIATNNGALAAIAVCPNIAAGGGPTSAAVHPTGRFLFVANQAGVSISVYPINPLNGCLGAPAVFLTGGVAPFSLGVTNDGSYLYVSDPGAGAVFGFAINPANGAIAPIGVWAAGANENELAIDLSGYVYVANGGPNGTITAFSINPGGVLVPVPGSPFGVGPNPFGLAVDPVDQYLFVTLNGGNTLVSYTIVPGAGALVAPNFIATGAAPLGVAASPFGQVVFEVNNPANTVNAYLLNQVNGAMAANGINPTGANPIGVTIEQSGKYLYVADNAGNTVHGYSINANTGKLLAIPTSPWATALAPFAIATTP